MSGPDRYERFGWDYEAFNPTDPRAEAWYLRHAREVGSPILEVACGTGRLALLLAEHGFEVTGVDLSPRMLARAEELRAAEPPDVRARVTFTEGDMGEFDLGRRFALALVADNSLRETGTRAGVLACLKALRCHLQPGGRLLVTERRFDPARFAGRGASAWSEPLTEPGTARTVRRRVRVAVDEEAGRLTGEMIYEIRDPDGSIHREVLPYESPVFSPAQYVALFEEAGLRARLCVGYEDRPDDGHDPWLCFVAHIREPDKGA